MFTTIPGTTSLTVTDILPLTCTNGGICCYSKAVWLNPWELARLAKAKGMTPTVFRDHHSDFGGIHLRFDGPPGWKGLTACSQYVPEKGCSVYAGRPLVCRLYPLGRHRRAGKLNYIHVGSSFPCLDVCPEVVNLPRLTVNDFLSAQEVLSSEIAQDEYLKLMQRLADMAFILLFDSGLAASGDRQTLHLWRKLGKEDPDQLAKSLGPAWIDRLMLPKISDGLEDPAAFAQHHHDLLQLQAQKSFGDLGNFTSLRDASGMMMGLALHLGRGLGVNPVDLGRHWIATAKKLGALE